MKPTHRRTGIFQTWAHRRLFVMVVSFAAVTAMNPAAPAGQIGWSTGNAATDATIRANAAAVANSQAAQQAALRAQAAMNSANAALAALRASQAAAAAAGATGSTVPNGLGAGGLDPVHNPNSTTDGLTTWVGAGTPTQQVNNGQYDVNIQQTQQNAILSWNSFNIGANTTLTFDQQGNASWVALNRVVGTMAPSQILGHMKADGTVLVINQNGIIFGAGSQINVHSLIASSLEFGPQQEPGGQGINATIAWRNQTFLTDGLLGLNPTVGTVGEFSVPNGVTASGDVTVLPGASITTTSDGGLILLMGHHVVNGGSLSSPAGQVILAAGEQVNLTGSTGDSTSADPNLRGLAVTLGINDPTLASGYYVWNQAQGLIEADQGNITLSSLDAGTINNQSQYSPGGAAFNDGVLWATTSVSRNGSILIDADNIRLGSGSLLSIVPDSGGATIPQDPTSLSDFKPSEIKIGTVSSTQIEMQSNATLYAPGANVSFGSTGVGLDGILGYARSILIDDGATIDVAGLTDVLVPATENQIVITPVKKNELRDSPLYRDGFLNGATIYLDPRISGVRADGVAWIGSPLIDAAAYYQLVGVSAAQLMTKGGSVSMGTMGFLATEEVFDPSTGGFMAVPNPTSAASNIIVRSGAKIDMSGGWVTYQGGNIRTSQLVTSDGRIVDIGNASPSDTYVGVYQGSLTNHPHWGVVENWTSPIDWGGGLNSHYEASYTEGRDAGTFLVNAPAIVLDGTVLGQAYAGSQQLSDAKQGTGTSSVSGDLRAVQGANSELPAGGALLIAGGSDIEVASNVPSLPDGSYGSWTGSGISGTGVYTPPTQTSGNPLPASRLDSVVLSDSFLSNSGLSEVSLSTQGKITVDAGTQITLNPGGVFGALAGRSITINGNITAPSGKIDLETFAGGGSDFNPADATAASLGDFDITINGNLDVAGRWVNDYGATIDSFEGGAWLNGGTISMVVASRVLKVFDANGNYVAPDTQLGSGESYQGNGVEFVGSFTTWDSETNPLPVIDNPPVALTAEDISGSITVASGAKLNLSGGGRIDQTGKLNLTATGGNLSLRSDDGYYQVTTDGGVGESGFRIIDQQVTASGDQLFIVVNPDRINARITIDPGSIEAHGFGGGGTFSLTTPQFDFGSGAADAGTLLPMDFFASAGFANYNITSYKTDITASTFTNGYGGYNAVLATQTLTVGAGQTLSLVQSVLAGTHLMTGGQLDALYGLASGGDVNSIVGAVTPADAYDQKAVNLTLGGLLELDVDAGGSVVGAAGGTLTVAKLYNAGTIRIPGGTILQQEILPTLYAPGIINQNDAVGVHSLSDIFGINPDGSIDPGATISDPNITDNDPNDFDYQFPIPNQDLAGDMFHPGTFHAIYMLGRLNQDQGIVLAAGSVTDLSGAVLVNPYATGINGRAIRSGSIVAGGTLASQPALQTATPLYYNQTGSYYAAHGGSGFRIADVIEADPGSTIDLSGASGSLDQFTGGGYVSTPVWSDGGSLLAGGGAILAGATINARGGAPQAEGGTLEVVNPIFTQNDPTVPAENVVSADMIAQSGFDTLIALGNITSVGDAMVKLGRAFFLEEAPSTGLLPQDGTGINADKLIPIISSGGALEIDAPYISLNSVIDRFFSPSPGTPGTGSVTFSGGQIDIAGSILFDQSVATVNLLSTGDLRMTGVAPWQEAFPQSFAPTFTTPLNPTLNGMLGVNGDLNITAAQIYPTTGSTYSITSAAVNGTITIGRSGDVPVTPYSAGGNLFVQSANIVQGGVIRVPFGTLTLGSNQADTVTESGVLTTYAPATQNVLLADGSVTSVSADGLSIPYGTTTDTIDWFFTPTGGAALAGPPVKVLSLGGNAITIASGATVDLSGGGDVYAYEFVPGTGGSRDVLSQFNSDQYSANFVNGVGYQYPDGRQVYAIVPGLSNASVAAYDPVYSANYGNLRSPSAVGQRVYLSGGNGLAAGWYTLLPAQYAMLPGGMRVVEQTGAANVVPGASSKLLDGSLLVSGYYGDALTGSSQSQVRQFSVESQAVIESYSDIVLTSGNATAASQASANGTLTPRIGLDAGRLVLSPLASLEVDAVLDTAAAPGGRGSQVDLSGTSIDILSTTAGAPSDGAIHLTTGTLNNLNAESLLIGGTRTDNADGTTNLAVSATTIVVANDADHPLVAPEIVLVVDAGLSGAASQLTLDDGATIIATGVLSDQRSGAYVIDGRPIATSTAGSTSVTFTAPPDSGVGALFRVANGPERLVDRLTVPGSPGSGALTVGSIKAQGTSIGFDTSNTVTIDAAAQLVGSNLSLGASAIAFTGDVNSVPTGTLVISPQLQALLSQGDHLTLRSQTSIGFDDGTYQFGNASLDAANIVSLQGGVVTLDADQLQLQNSGAAGTAATGTGTLDIVAGQLTFGSGTMATSGIGQGVNLTAAQGIFSSGVGGVFDVGANNLSVTAPYIGDRGAVGVVTGTPAGMTLKTTGTVAVTNAGTTPLDLTPYPGVPGSSLTIQGSDIGISGTVLRATAGTLNLQASGTITLSNGAVLETPGYSETYGDSVDPQTASAPGGTLSLTAAGAGGISLGNALLSVGNGTGNAGTLKLSTPNGAVDLGTATLNGTGGAGDQGGTFSLDTQSMIDLVALNTLVGADGFTGGFDLSTHVGDIVLGAGQTLNSGSVNLTADGGSVTIAGTIDTSGVNGGDIALYGVNGVTLQGTAKLDAHADGYAANDTRSATGGNVTLGTDFLAGTTSTSGTDGSISGTSGAIDIMAGAVIDVSARRPGDRLVQVVRDGVVNYAFVQGDQGGTVTLRAPVIADGSGGTTVNVTVASAGSVVGAREIDLEGFKRWDLAAVAASGNYSGVAYDSATDTVTLDAGADLDTANPDGTTAAVGGVNFLGDKGAGTVVDFVQNYSVTDANLGGLDAVSGFQSRPGVELDHTGSIVLASNWNLGAGLVDVTGATAAGVMGVDPTSGQSYVVPGQEGKLLDQYTEMLYRVGGSASGAAPVVSLRAGGDLHLKGSLTDGFFEFRDQYDPTYQSFVGAPPTSFYSLELDFWPNFGDPSAPFESYSDYINDPTAPSDAGNLFREFRIDQGQYVPAGAALQAPYSALGNSPAALASGVDSTHPFGVGDPLGSAEVFPLLPSGKIVASSGYRLVAGAALGSADPLRLLPTASGNLIVDGARQVSETVNIGNGGFAGVDLQLFDFSTGAALGNPFLPGQSGFDTFAESFYPGMTSDVDVSLQYTVEPTALADFAAAHPGDVTTSNFGGSAPVEVDMSLATFAELVATPAFAQIVSTGPSGSGQSTINMTPQTVVRTGTGSIHMAAAGNVDLTGGSTVTYLNQDGTVSSGNSSSTGQVGGAGVYTVGHPVAAVSEILPDPVTGIAVTVSAPASASNVFNTSTGYLYGAGTGFAGVAIANAVDLAGGGDIDVTAGGSVLGRRDYSLGNIIKDGVTTYNHWVGSADQPWRPGSDTETVTQAAINPQLFRDGLGALGGGDIDVNAGGSISDLTVADDDSLITATATPAGGAPTKVLVTLGGGNVAIRAGGDILGNRIDVASGTARVAAGGSIGITPGLSGGQQEETWVRIDDATVSLSARGTLSLQGVGQLDAFYSPASALNLVANGTVTVTNDGLYNAQFVNFYQLANESDAIYPGTFTLASLLGDADLETSAASGLQPQVILMVPSPTGELSILAAGNIDATKIAMLDTDPNLLPGLFTVGADNVNGEKSGFGYSFPTVTSNMSDQQLDQQHNAATTHAGDAVPVYLYAGNDIGGDLVPVLNGSNQQIGTSQGGVTLSVPKQARIEAGRDIVDMIFFGQNLAAGDVTRIVAGRDIIGTTELVPSTTFTVVDIGGAFITEQVAGPTLPTMAGNTFVLGGPGDMVVQAGRNLGPFLNSADINEQIPAGSPPIYQDTPVRFGGGIITVGNAWNPFLPAVGAQVTALFGVDKGIDYDALSAAYVAPGTAANALGGYGPKLVAWMQQNAAAALTADFGTTDVSDDQAYAAFTGLPELRQQFFLIQDVYFNELNSTADPSGPSFHDYSRGYQAVNTLFPASLGYTANSLEGGATDEAIVHTGDLDLRLATIETQFGGSVYILGPGGRVLAGSVVSTVQQAARRNYDGVGLFTPQYSAANPPLFTPIEDIPTGYEGVLTLRGGDINTFTDGDFLLNQSRVFTEQGGNITMWSSNADLNAGQGAKTSANFPPVVIHIDQDAFVTVDALGGVTGAGIATLPTTPDSPPGNVDLIAPRGTVDAGDAGVRFSGELNVAALFIANADNFIGTGPTTGIPTAATVDTSGLAAASNASGAALNSMDDVTKRNAGGDISVDVMGYGGGDGSTGQ